METRLAGKIHEVGWEEVKNNQAPQVYLFKCGKFVKIGRTKSLGARLDAMRTGNPYAIGPLFSILTQHPKEVEATLHDFYSAQRRLGEWFELTDEHLNEIERAVELALDMQYGNA